VDFFIKNATLVIPEGLFLRTSWSGLTLVGCRTPAESLHHSSTGELNGEKETQELKHLPVTPIFPVPASPLPSHLLPSTRAGTQSVLVFWICRSE